MTPADEKALRTYLATLAMAGFRDNKADLALCTDDVIRFVRKLAAGSPPSAGEEELRAALSVTVAALEDHSRSGHIAGCTEDLQWDERKAAAIAEARAALTKGERR